jgi:uncharacterized protein YgiM (DUF1202 family)
MARHEMVGIALLILSILPMSDASSRACRAVDQYESVNLPPGSNERATEIVHGFSLTVNGVKAGMQVQTASGKTYLITGDYMSSAEVAASKKVLKVYSLDVIGNGRGITIYQIKKPSRLPAVPQIEKCF